MTKSYSVERTASISELTPLAERQHMAVSCLGDAFVGVVAT
jgi:hypothetical protein